MPVTIITDPLLAKDDGLLPTSTPIRARAIHALRKVMDPELPLNIYDLGLIYALELDDEKQAAHIIMTLTAPNCPVAEELPKQAQKAVEEATGYTTTLRLTFDPPWSKENLPLEAKLTLGLL